MNPNTPDELERIKQLHLILIYLTGWEEDSIDNPGKKIYKAWKGYLFQALDELEAQKMLLQHQDSQLILLTPKGKNAAKQLLMKYLKD
ncbi:MAG: transposase [bacterium]|nr:transposase [bacterium]